MARKSLSKVLDIIENASSEAPIEKRFINDLTYSIEQTANKGTHKPSKAFKPSSIGGCERNLYYQLCGAEQNKTNNSSYSNVGILESGTDRHIRLQEAICEMKNNGIDCEYVDVADFIKQHGLDYLEVKEKSGMETKCFWKEIPLSFLTDGIVRYNGQYYILEIKTMNSKKFFESKDVRQEHIAQGVCYSLAFKLNKVLYLYENRETLDKKAFILEVTDGMRKGLLNKTERVKECVKNHIPPEINPNNHMCAYCSYSELCKIDNKKD